MYEAIYKQVDSWVVSQAIANGLQRRGLQVDVWMHKNNERFLTPYMECSPQRLQRTTLPSGICRRQDALFIRNVLWE
jgi:hypothetical protein